jgi:hypothetical protein
MTADFLATRRAEGQAGAHRAPGDGREVRLALTVRLETPGEACVAVSSAVAFAYAPPLPDDVAVRLDDRLYDCLYDGPGDQSRGQLPPERLRLHVTALRSEPPLAALLTPIEWGNRARGGRSPGRSRRRSDPARLARPRRIAIERRAMSDTRDSASRRDGSPRAAAFPLSVLGTEVASPALRSAALGWWRAGL